MDIHTIKYNHQGQPAKQTQQMTGGINDKNNDNDFRYNKSSGNATSDKSGKSKTPSRD